MADLPCGTVTLLFTDIEGSTRLLQQTGDAYTELLHTHAQLLRAAFERHSGVEVSTAGDAFFVAFASASEAAAAAAEGQQALAGHDWPENAEIRVRIGIHTGEPQVIGCDYVGLDVHRAARVMAAGHGGQVLLSEATRKHLGSDLAVIDLGEHRLKDLLQPEHLYQLSIEGLATEFPAVKTIGNRPTNLPVLPNPLIGRDDELQRIGDLLRRENVRLLTLTGAGGTGKTRLALQVGAELLDDFPSGVFFVPLAPLRDPAFVVPTIAKTLAVREVPGERLLDTLCAYLAERELLLVLDNFEGLVAAGAELSELLVAAPAPTLLATSRQRLNLSAEREYAVLPLRERDAVALFHERVTAIEPGVIVNGDVPEICRRLDGLPLAIELAAARVKVLAPRALLERLERRLPVLTGGPHDLPERQRTLRATIDWSYELLTPDEQRLFARLAVFSGGCTLEAAEEICEADLDTLQSLVDKSLLRHTGRFWMLETIREYATERLETSDEADGILELHARWYLELSERAYPELRGADHVLWLEQLEQEHDNFRSALGRQLESADVENALRLASALARFWHLRGYLEEGRHWLETCIRRSGTSPVRPRALRGLAVLAMEQGDLDRGAAAAEEALDIDKAAGDEGGAVKSMGILANIVAFRGDLASARALYEANAELAGRIGDRRELAVSLYDLGHIARLEGHPQMAGERFEESLAIFRELEDLTGQAGALQSLVEVAFENGETDRAFSLLRVSTELFHATRHISGLINSLDSHAGLLAQVGEAEAASLLWGAYQARNEELGRDAAHPLEDAARAESIDALRKALGDAAFERAWAAGASMSLDDALAFALARNPADRRAASGPARAR
jgi:predicted ATPase/class 3 adenylate cyclase